MAFEDKKTTQTAQKDFNAPATCTKCGKLASVALATCVNTGNGSLKTGAASEFCSRDNANNPNWVLQDWWQLSKYKGFCPDCYAGLSQPGARRYSDNEVRGAWQWFLGEMAARSKGDAIGSAFKRIKLDNAQIDAALEIVNFEAHRTNQPDAIPDEFKIAGMWA